VGDRDYHDFTTKDTPVAERHRLNCGDLWVNAARCHGCGEVVRSHNKHDYRTCGCGSLAVAEQFWKEQKRRKQAKRKAKKK